MIAPIIAAFDAFRGDRAPVDLALAAAELTGADVIVASVLPVERIERWAESRTPDTRPRTIALAQARLREEYGVAETRVVSGVSVPHALHALAQEEHAGLVVVGSSGRGRIGRVLPGSTAERMLHGGPCPVVLAPHGYVRAPLETIAVGFLDSPEGHAALGAAHRLAARTGARLRVIAAIHPSGGLDAATAAGTPPQRGVALEGHHRAAAEAALGRAIDALPAGVDIESEIHVDEPADVLVRVSEHADLLVCGSRGYGPVRSVLLGGVSRRLVNGACCPVLVLAREAQRPLDSSLGEAAAGATAGR